jgi:Tetracyclin repressor-like, C-terminal domain
VLSVGKAARYTLPHEIHSISVPAIEGLKRVYECGVKEGIFRAGLDPVDWHMSISALSVFNVANRRTFALLFKGDFDTAGHKKNAETILQNSWQGLSYAKAKSAGSPHGAPFGSGQFAH